MSKARDYQDVENDVCRFDREGELEKRAPRTIAFGASFELSYIFVIFEFRVLFLYF